MAAHEVLKTIFLNMQRQMSILLESRDETLRRAESSSVNLAICRACLQEVISEKDKLQLQVDHLKVELAIESAQRRLVSEDLSSLDV